MALCGSFLPLCVNCLSGQLELEVAWDTGRPGASHTGATFGKLAEAGAARGCVDPGGKPRLGGLGSLAGALVGASLGRRESQGQVSLGLLWQVGWSYSWSELWLQRAPGTGRVGATLAGQLELCWSGLV